MKIQINSVDEYIESLPEQRIEAVGKLRRSIADNIPAGFKETMISGIPGYVVPLSTFPDGYHCTPNTPLPFLSFASQKNFVALYHFGMYVDRELMSWFVDEYPKYVKTKLDMGKSCIRFKKVETIPFELIAELAAKRTVDDWVSCYQSQLQSS